MISTMDAAPCFKTGGAEAERELVRLIGLAGNALVQLRNDYELRPSLLTLHAIRRKVNYVAALAQNLQEMV